MKKKYCCVNKKTAMSKTVRVKGRCVRVPDGQVAHKQRHCKAGETWRAGHERVVRAHKKSMKTIQKNIRSNVESHRLAQKCSTEDLATIIDSCLSGMIEDVREHIARKEHLGVEDYPSPKTLEMIREKTAKGTRCVLAVLNRCGGNRDQIRLMVDQYIQEQLNVDSMIPPMEKNIIERRAEKLGEIDDFVKQFRSGLRVGESSLSKGSYLPFSALL